jgi:hypothetical protein
MRRGSKKPCVSKLAEVGLLHNAIPSPVPHLINSYDPAGVQSRFSLNQLNFPTKIQLKDFIPLLKINPFIQTALRGTQK